MLTPRFVVSIFSVGLLVIGSGVVSGQNYPDKPIRMLTAGVGGGGDIVMRIMTPGLARALGQPVIVDNRAQVVANQLVSVAAPDGYTLTASGNSLWIGKLLGEDVTWDATRDFSPITLTTRAPIVLVVHPSLPVRSTQELIALAKAKPGELTYVLTAIGSASHLASALFKSMTGINMVGVPYQSASQKVIDLVAGRIQLAFAQTGTVVQHVKSGKLSALAVTSSEPSALMPGVPTVAATGVPGYESTQALAIFAPAKTPVTIIKRLNQEIVRVLNQSDVKEKLLESGVEVVGNLPQELEAKVRSDIAKWSKVIKEGGIKTH